MGESLDIAMSSATRTALESGRTGSWYRFLPLILLGTSTAGWLWMVRLAVDDPGFATEPDYYQKAVDFDRRQELERRSEQRGWSVRVVEAEIDEVTERAARGRLAFELTDREGRPVEDLTLDAEAFPNARASRVQHVDLVGRGAGRYTAELESPRSGIWEIRLHSRDPKRAWTRTLSVEFGAGEVEK